MKNKEVYTQSEVDEKVKEMLTLSEVKISRLRDKVNELKGEIIKQQKTIDAFENKEVEVADAIEKYKNKSKYFENIIKMRCEMEISRLKNLDSLLSAEFKGYNKSGKAILDSVINSLDAFSKDFTEVQELSKLEPMHKSVDSSKDLENRYLKILSIYEYSKANDKHRKRGRPKKEEENIETYLKQRKKEKEKKNESAFDIEEAMHPTKPLEEIMKEVFDN